MKALEGVEPVGTRLAAVASVPRQRCPRAGRLDDHEAGRFADLTEPGPVPPLHPDMTPCVLWTGSAPNGYGSFGQQDGCGQWFTRRAYVVAWEHANGLVPEGLVLDHLCQVTRCVNPEHLEPVPQWVNVYRGRSFMAQRAAATHCVNGHPLSGPNLYERKDRVRGDGRPQRQCRACDNARRRKVRP